MTTEENMMDLHKPFGNAGGMMVPVMVNDSGISRVGRHLPSGCAGTLDYNPLLSVVDTQRLPSLCHISDNENGVPVGRNGQLPEQLGAQSSLRPSSLRHPIPYTHSLFQAGGASGIRGNVERLNVGAGTLTFGEK